MRRALCSLAIFTLSVFAIDFVVGGSCRATALPDRVTDIRHPTTLMTKLDRLQSAPGPKVVLVGDSLVHGGILSECGDDDWRQHELGEQVAAEVGERTGCRPFVMNLGMDGALPADLERLVPLVAACGVDWIVLDVHLRPFSTDFTPPDRQMSRPWLRDLDVGAGGRIRWRPDGGVWNRLAGHLADYSAIVRNRGLVQDNLLSSRPARRPARRSMGPSSETDAEVQSLVRLAQLKNRLKALDLGPDGPQVRALDRLLAGLAVSGQRYVVFYATENPALLPEIMDPDEHAARYERLASLVCDAQGPRGVFVPPMSELQPAHFIDFTHLNANGYRLLARRLADTIK